VWQAWVVLAAGLLLKEVNPDLKESKRSINAVYASSFKAMVTGLRL